MTLLVLCDGVGSRQNGALYSKAVGEAAVECTSRYLKARRSRRGIGERDVSTLRQRIQRLSVLEVPGDPACTLVLVLLDRRRRKDGYPFLVIWAGDSRAIAVGPDGKLDEWTHDHHDEEGRLRSYFGRKGRVFGSLGSHCGSTAVPNGVCLTSDGIHERCEAAELARFVRYCMHNQICRDEELLAELTFFLGRNINDNYSMILAYLRS